jgi:integrase
MRRLVKLWSTRFIVASIQKRGSTYRARVIRRGYPTQSKTFNTRIEATKWARGIEAQIDSGTLQTTKQPSIQLINTDTPFKVAADYYIKTHTIHKRNYKSETYIINALIRYWGDISICKIDIPKALKVRDDLLANKRTGDTINKYFNAISKIFQMLQNEWSLSLNNPIKGIKRMSANPGRTKRINGLIEKTLIQAAQNTSPRLLMNILELSLETGMRRGELMGLNWIDIDLEKRRIYLHITKNGEPRQVPLTQKAVAILKEIPRSNPDKVFPVSLCWLRKRFEVTRNSAKGKWCHPGENPFNDLRFHDLRHEALSRLSDAGLNVIELAHISGHKTLAMLKRYTHPSHEAIFAKLDIQYIK